MNLNFQKISNVYVQNCDIFVQGSNNLSIFGHIRTKEVGKPLNDYYTDILNDVQETGDSKLKYIVL